MTDFLDHGNIWFYTGLLEGSLFEQDCTKNWIGIIPLTRARVQDCFCLFAVCKKNLKVVHDFKEVRESIEDEKHPRRPWTSTDEKYINQIKDLLLDNRQLTLRK